MFSKPWCLRWAVAFKISRFTYSTLHLAPERIKDHFNYPESQVLSYWCNTKCLKKLFFQTTSCRSGSSSSCSLRPPLPWFPVSWSVLAQFLIMLSLPSANDFSLIMQAHMLQPFRKATMLKLVNPFFTLSTVDATGGSSVELKRAFSVLPLQTCFFIRTYFWSVPCCED